VRIIDAAAGQTDSPGERKLVQTLADELDDAYTLFRGVLLPRATDAIDAVLVGPFGVLVVTIYEYKGTYACDGDEWFYSPDNGQSWQLSTENPVKQVLYDHIQLKAYLDREGLRGVPFEKAVVFPNSKTQVVPQQPAARLFRLRELQLYAQRLTGQAYLTPTQVDDIVAVLEKTVRIATARMRSSEAPGLPARRTGDKLSPWLIVLGVLLLCISATCFASALLLLLQNLM
jgi:hypothetical protein